MKVKIQKSGPDRHRIKLGQSKNIPATRSIVDCSRSVIFIILIQERRIYTHLIPDKMNSLTGLNGSTTHSWMLT